MQQMPNRRTAPPSHEYKPTVRQGPRRSPPPHTFPEKTIRSHKDLKPPGKKPQIIPWDVLIAGERPNPKRMQSADDSALLDAGAWAVELSPWGYPQWWQVAVQNSDGRAAVNSLWLSPQSGFYITNSPDAWIPQSSGDEFGWACWPGWNMEIYPGEVEAGFQFWSPGTNIGYMGYFLGSFSGGWAGPVNGNYSYGPSW